MIEQIREAARFGFERIFAEALRRKAKIALLARLSSFFGVVMARRAIFCLMIACAVPAVAQPIAQTGDIGVNDAIIADPNSGVALFGYDPVAYFIDGRAIAGLPGVNLIEQGLVWRFTNEGNREAFKADPAAYIPVYGGYDPRDVARERLVAGRPEIFAIVDGKLMLFRHDDSRDATVASAGLRAEAARKWPSVSRGLARVKR